MDEEEQAIAWQIITHLSEIEELHSARICIATNLTAHTQPQGGNKIEFIMAVPPSASDLVNPPSTPQSDQIVTTTLLRWRRKMADILSSGHAVLRSTANLLTYDPTEFVPFMMNGTRLRFVHMDMLPCQPVTLPTVLQASRAEQLPMLTADDLIIAKLRLSGLSKHDKTASTHADDAGDLLDTLERPRRLSAQQKECAREAVMHLRQFQYSRQWFRDELGI